MKNMFRIFSLLVEGVRHRCIRYMAAALLIGLFPTALSANARCGFERISETAETLAAEPFKAPPPIPDFLTHLTYDQYRDIRFDPRQSLWKDAGSKFQVQFIHPGLFYNHAVTINVCDETSTHKVDFSPKFFIYGKNQIANQIPADLGFAGFRLTYPLLKKTNTTTSSSSPAPAISGRWLRTKFLDCRREDWPSIPDYLRAKSFLSLKSSG